jgi:HAD superfamily hydrolase (TIGR01509 family)
MIQAIIYDFGNVVCSFRVTSFFENLTRHSACTVDQLLGLMPEISHLAIEYESGHMTSEEFFRAFSALARINLSQKDFIASYTSIFTPITGTYDAIRRLKGRYKLGLLSNTNEWHFEHSIRTVEVFPLFDAVTLSYEVRAMKPHPAIYQDMLQKLGVPAHACVYFDDIQENVDAGDRAGMQGRLFTTAERMHADLMALGVTF